MNHSNYTIKLLKKNMHCDVKRFCLRIHFDHYHGFVYLYSPALIDSHNPKAHNNEVSAFQCVKQTRKCGFHGFLEYLSWISDQSAYYLLFFFIRSVFFQITKHGRYSNCRNNLFCRALKIEDIPWRSFRRMLIFPILFLTYAISSIFRWQKCK